MADENEAQARSQMLAAAAKASATLDQSIVGKAAETPIETNVHSLRGLAGVIAALVEDANRCGGIDCMGRSIDGTKLWVTRDRLKEVNRRATRYEAALRAIAAAGRETGDEMDMLIDWQGTARALSAAARQALE